MDHILDIDEIVSENKKQEHTRLGLFESMLLRCHSLIKRHNKERIREMEYTIPAFVYGKPKYDIDVLRNYLVHHLKDNGLRVDVLDRYHLYISWKETDIDLARYIHRKTLIANRNRSIYMVDDTEAALPPSKVEMMKFRQDRQRELQRDREGRFAMQRQRKPDSMFGDYLRSGAS
jgi:hypothetical protein